MRKGDGKSTEMIRKNRVVIVGCGKIAGLMEDKLVRHPYSHATAFYNNSSFIISGCVDSDHIKAKKFSEKYSIDVQGDNIEKIIDHIQPHVISICTPDDTHFDIVKRVLTNKQHSLKLIFLEKPVCSTVEELDEIISMSEVSGTPVLVNMSRRYHPWYRHLREQYDKQKLGDLIRGDIFYSGGWRHNGVHALDTIEFLFPSQSSMGEIQEYWGGRDKNDPTYTVSMKLNQNGAPIWFHGFNENYYGIFDCDLKFTGGRLRITNYEEEIRWEKVSINSLGERVLIRGDLQFPTVRKSCIEEAVILIQNYLHFLEKNELEGYRVQDIVATMRTIWAVDEKRNDGSY